MKKSLFATLAAVAVAAMCVPAFSGCSASVGYILKTDEDGNQYYSVKADGFTSALKGEVVIPETYGDNIPVKEIENQAFAGTSITKVTIPKTIETIGTAAFAYSDRLKEVVFAEDIELEEISWGSFGYCTSLQSITVPSSVKTVDGMAFTGCIALKTVELPEGLVSINWQAFSGCEMLTSINFSEKLITIGAEAFFNCTSLESVIIPGTHVSGGLPLDENGNPVAITLGEIAFFGCDNLKLVVLGEGVEVISEGLFASCVSLETVYLPLTLKEVKGIYQTESGAYGHAFYNTPKLKTVHYAGDEYAWEDIKIDKTTYQDISDNSSLLNAKKIFGSVYVYD